MHLAAKLTDKSAQHLKRLNLNRIVSLSFENGSNHCKFGFEDFVDIKNLMKFEFLELKDQF